MKLASTILVGGAVSSAVVISPFVRDTISHSVSYSKQDDDFGLIGGGGTENEEVEWKLKKEESGLKITGFKRIGKNLKGETVSRILGPRGVSELNKIWTGDNCSEDRKLEDLKDIEDLFRAIFSGQDRTYKCQEDIKEKIIQGIKDKSWAWYYSKENSR